VLIKVYILFKFFSFFGEEEEERRGEGVGGGW